MLYLFGQLALSDSLYYHENFQDDDYQKENPAGSQGLEKPAADARAVAIGRRLRRGRHLPQPGRADAGRIGCA